MMDHLRAARVGRIAVLAIGDVCALLAAGGLAYVLWARPVKAQAPGLYLDLVPLVSVFLLGYAQAGLYPGFGVGPVEALRRFSYATAFSFLILAAFSFALKLPPLYSRVTFGLALLFSLVLVPMTRAIVMRVAGGWGWWSEPVAVVGTGERAMRAIRAIQASHFGYRPAAVLALETDAVGSEVSGVPVFRGLDQASMLAARGIRVALLEREGPQDRPTIDRLQRDFGHVVLMREYSDLPVEGVQIRNLGGVLGIEYTNNLLLGGNRLVKRAMDVVIACTALMLATPVIACAAALVWLLDGRPVLFTQERVGASGRRIRVPKIRTMRRDAEARLAQHLAADPVLRAEWDATYKLRDDPRVIPIVGGILRRFSVDELPQFWTVLTGRMSLVGPRPFPEYHVAQLPSAFRDLRERVLPGITGLWQISVRSDGGLDEQQVYDTYYIRNWSVWLDLYVLGRTMAAVAFGRGAY